jgi:hypothetical protein
MFRLLPYFNQTQAKIILAFLLGFALVPSTWAQPRGLERLFFANIEKYAYEHAGAIAILRDSALEQHRPAHPELWMSGRLSCSAFHIGGGVVITSGHCTSQNWKGVTLEWTVASAQGAPASKLISKVMANLGRSVEPELSDYQILLVTPAPSTRLPFSPQRRMVENEMVFAMGHPFGGALTASRPQYTYSVDSCESGQSLIRAFHFPVREGQYGGPLISYEDGLVVGVLNSDTQATLLQCMKHLASAVVSHYLAR